MMNDELGISGFHKFECFFSVLCRKYLIVREEEFEVLPQVGVVLYDEDA